MSDKPVPDARPSTVAVVTLGCARNEVDSEELAGRLAAGGFELVGEPATAETVVVNTCGFVTQAKLDSIETVQAAAEGKSAGSTKRVVAVGCLAERYGNELADSLSEADAVLSFDDYPDIAARLRSILAGDIPDAHVPHDRRALLPITPVDRQAAGMQVPGHGTDADSLTGAPASGPRRVRRRLDGSPYAPLKLASGCDRRCSFCAIPAFRGSFLSRPAVEVISEAMWLAESGVRELFLVSENSTSYGKDLGDLRLLEQLLPQLAAVPGIDRVRVSYLQPAEMRPGLVATIATTAKVAPYFDLSFQHTAPEVLKRMRRFGDSERFLALLDDIRALAPLAGVRSNFIVGFPGETAEDFDTLLEFVEQARLDAIGVFGYSDEDGTEAERFSDKIDEDEIADRVEQLSALADHLVAQRAAERIGEQVDVLVESIDDAVTGRAAHQGPDVDGVTTITGAGPSTAVGDWVTAAVVDTDGVDLIAEPVSR